MTEPNTAPQKAHGPSADQQKIPIYQTATIIFGVASSLLGVSGLVGMVLGIAAFRSIIPGYQTMAFSTAVLLIGIGAFLVTGAIRTFGRSTRLVVQAAMVLIIVIEAIEFPLNIWGSHGLFESLMVGIGNAIAGTPTSPISPATIILVILTSFGCILLTAPREPSGKSRSRDGAGLLGLVVALVSFTIILSYLYGVPIMYGSGLIPAAASTAIAFLALGSGLITAAGPGAVPLAYFSGDSIRAHLLRTFLPLTIVTILVGGGLEITRRIFGGTFDAILTAASIVVFSLIVGFVVFRASDRVGSALEAAERERQKAEDDLRVKNTELEAAYEKLTATDEELQQNYDELAKSQETLLKSEARLRLSSAYNRSLIEASLDPLVTISPDGTISDVNSATVNITGFSRGELIGTDFSRYFTEPDKAKAGYETVFREGIVKDYALEIQHVDGRVTPVLYNASVYRDEQGRAIGAFAAARDITVQKQAESALQNAHDELEERVEQRTAELEQRNEELGALNEELTATQEELHQNLDELTLSEKALSESEERYRTRFNALIEGFCVIEMVFDPAGKPVDYRFLEINPAFEAQTGLRNATGKLMRDLAPDHEQPWFDIYGKVAVTGEPVHFENEAAALGRWYEVRAFRVGGEESRKVAICFNDVTERKNAEAEKSNLASIVENSDDAIIGKTPDGIITTWNAGAEKIYGYSAAEVIGRSVSILIPPDKTDDIEYIVAKIKRGESFIHYETDRIKNDGTLMHVSLTMSPIRDITGKLTGASTIARDITDRKRAEKALHESEEKFRILFTRMVEGSALHELVYSASGDPVDYRILDINPSFEHILGLKREDVIGKTSKEAYGVDEPPYFDIYRRVAETGQPVEFEVFFAPMKKHFAISAYSPEHGKFATIFTDITERKNAEQNIRTLLGEVQREKDRLSSLINSISDEVWFADTQKNFTLANPAALKEFALDNDSVDVEKFAASLEVYRPDGSPRPVEEAPPLRALKGEEVRNLEEMVRTPGTGEVRYRQVNSNPVRDADGNIIGAVSVVRDITARKQVEEALSESEERFRLALRNAPVSVAVQDTDLIYRWTYNQTTRRADEIVGMTDADLFAKEDVEWLTPLKQRILRTGEDAHTENWLTSNGRPEYLDLYFEPLRNKGGEITGIGIAAVDLTDLKLAKEELQNKNDNLNVLNEELTAAEEKLNQNIEELSLREEDLSKALAEKEVLLSEIHHRVKNNLTAFISLLSLEGSTEETPAGRSLKQDLQNRARSMALIHETLYRTHMYNNVDMEMYLATLLDQVTHSLQTSKQVKVNVDAHGVLLDIPRATPSGLIVNELITNAFKYAFPDSFDSQKVRDAPPTITVTFAQNGGEYVMIVRDNGIGLPPGFDISTTKTLGLKLVNFLARHQLNATIEVNTGKGTEFIFRFKV